MIRLSSADWQAELRPDCGMNTVSLSYKGIPILRSPDSDEELMKNPCVYGTPILLPPNRTADGVFSFDGRRYELPITETVSNCNLHGLVNRTAFKVTEQRETYIAASLENRGELFPFPFIIEAKYGLTGDCYKQEFVIRNSGNTAMPLTFGLHTTFICRGSFAVPVGDLYERDDRNLPTGKLLPTEPGHSYITGDNNMKAVSGYFRSKGSCALIDGFEYRVSEGFDHWTLWNGGGGRGFIAVEPQCGAVNCLNNRIGLRRLESGEMLRFETKIRPRNPHLA